MQTLQENDFQSHVLDADGVIVVDYGAAWCGPCKKIKPILENLSEEMGEVKFYYVDAGEQPALAQKYGVMSLPTLLFFKNGEVVDRIVGLVAKEKIVEKIQTVS